MTEQIETVKPIAQVLVDVSRDVGAVKKEGVNSYSGYNFRGIDGVVNAVWPQLHKHGVFMQPEVVEIHYSTANTTSNKLTNIVRLKYKLTFHGPAGDSISVVVWGEANDTGDKATAKAHSVALRTALLQALCLPTMEPDPDADTYEHTQQQQGPTAEQVAQYKQIYARLSTASTVDEVDELVAQSIEVGCLEPIAAPLITVITNLIPTLGEVQQLQDLWKVAEAGGVLNAVREAITSQVKRIKAQAAQVTSDAQQ